MSLLKVSMLCLSLAAALCTLVSSCSDENTASPDKVLPACARNDALAQRLGCVPLAEQCEPPPAACDALADAWFTCVERDLRQCICEESDRELNCEGSFKPDEGPARCIDEYRALDACVGDEDEAP